MSTHHFTLIVEGPDLQGDDARLDALYDAGCSDGLVGRSEGVQYIEFDREAPDLDRAILSAVADVEHVDGITVVRIVDSGLVSMADIAARIGRTRESVRLLVTGARGPGGFPPPVTDPRRRLRLWRWSEVKRWLAQHLGAVSPSSDDEVVAAVNASLELRRYGKRTHPDHRSRLRVLAGL